jgi:hypothetical protein
MEWSGSMKRENRERGLLSGRLRRRSWDNIPPKGSRLELPTTRIPFIGCLST